MRLSGFHRALVPALLVAALSATAQAAQDVIEPDRPDVTNGSHLVPSRVVQIEAGYLYTRVAEDRHNAGSPITLRIGLRDWVEARFGFDGLLLAADAEQRESGIGNVQLGAKIRLWPESDGQSRLSVNPQFTVGTASAEKGLGSGESDLTITALFGVDLGRRARVDMNYGINAVSVADRDARFFQHLASASASVALGVHWSPYFELFGVSRNGPGGTPLVSIGTGTLYALRPRLAFDGGIAFGLSDDAPAFAAFGGVSVAFGGARPAPATEEAVAPARSKLRRFRRGYR